MNKYSYNIRLICVLILIAFAQSVNAQVLLEGHDDLFDWIPPIVTDFFISADKASAGPPTKSNPRDFVGRIYAPGPEDGRTRIDANPVNGVTLTIMSGPRSGESVETNPNGYYLFPNVEGDELHLLVEKEHFEPKEAIVHRWRATSLPNGITPNYYGDIQQSPGNILIGQRWYDEVRFIIDQVSMPPDLLFMNLGKPDHEDAGGFYTESIVAIHSSHIAQWYGKDGVLGIVAHELVHAHQHSLVSHDGTGSSHDWVHTPGAAAFDEARKKDWQEVGKTLYDLIPHFLTLVEGSAESAGYYWAEIGGFSRGWTNRWIPGGSDKRMKEVAPNRFKWAEQWVKVSLPSIVNGNVDIPDPSLRATVETALGKAPGVSITAADMARLTELYAPDADIRDLTGLEHATNLTALIIEGTPLSDISSVADLISLTELHLADTGISDISSLAGLTNLTSLGLRFNPLSDISAVADLTNLAELDLSLTGISDISSLTGLTHLTRLQLFGNSISDLSPLVANTGLGSGDYVDVNDNPLSTASINTHIPALEGRGARVEYDVPPVNIPDPNLRAEIEKALGKASGATITTADMANLTRLEANEAGISDLTGLEHATNLKELVLWDNDIADISVVASLTHLTRLRLEGNNISDVSVVSGLTGLTYLNLSDTNITDLSVVSGLMNLRELHLWNNSVKDLSPLAGLINLESLYIGRNGISDLSPLAGLTNLATLGLERNDITDLSALKGLTNLSWMRLDENNITDLSPLVANTGLGSGDTINVKENPLNSTSIYTHIPALEGRGARVEYDVPPVNIPDPNLLAEIAFTLNKSWGDPITVVDMAKLTRLDARNADISDLTGLEHATNLTRLDLADEYVEAEGRWINSNSVSNLSPLSGLTNLTSLTLGRNNISDLSPLAGLTNLTSLTLGHNNISDLSPLVGLTNLTGLRLRNNNITDLSALAGLTNLTLLVLGSNSVSDLSALSGLTNLTVLLLWYNAISDLSPLAGLTNLTELRIQGNRITDLSVLAGLTNLTRLAAAGNGITDISAVSGLTNLATLGLGHNGITDISVVSGLTNLTRLGLKDNNISDISVLAGLTSLEFVNLDRNSVSDLSPLVANTGIAGGDEVRVPGNPLSYPSLHAHIPALQGRGVDVQFNNRTPTTLRKISGTVTASDNVLIVDVRDENDNPFAGVPVMFTVTSGGGTLSVTSTTTNIDGRAESTLALGSDGEPNNVEASAAGTEQTVTFSDVPAPAVAIPDPHLHAAIAQTLGKAAGLPITVEDMERLTHLEAPNANISDLTGLEHATNLTYLNLRHEDLESGRVNSNAVWDLSPLAGLTKLTELWIDSNSVSDLTPLSGLTNLWRLEAGANNITDLSPLAGLTNLGGLGLWENEITDISAVAGLTNLGSLWLWENNITDISAVAGLTNLRRVSFGGNRNITDISPLAGLTNLIELHIPGVNISDVSVVTGLTNLEQLNLGGSNITDISFLSNLTRLRDLSLEGTLVTDISLLSGLTELRKVRLNWNRITDISPLVGNTELTEVRVRGNRLNYSSLRTHIPALEQRGVYVEFDPRTPMTLEKVSGDQHGSPATSLPKPFVIEVQAEWGVPFAGVPVTFSVTAGDGTLSVTSTETDENGRAESTLTLGPALGRTTVEVSAAEIHETVSFTAVAREGVIIPDSKLRTAIGIALEKSFGEPIVASDMVKLTSLEASGAGISDITGLELATNLTQLFLDRNNITDISVLAGLTQLTELRLGDNNITDISVLASLTELTELSLWSNNITDISAVAGLTELTELSLGGNRNITDISAVAGLTQLEFVFLGGNNITDISAVAGLTRLIVLGLGGNDITDISVLAGLTQLAELRLGSNDITDISVLAGLTQLTGLSLGGNNITDISAVAGLTELTELSLWSNNITDISAVAGLTELTELSLGGNRNITDISAVAGLAELTRLNLWSNDITDISVLAGLTQLEWLELVGNSIWDLSPLVENTGLGSGDTVLLWDNPLSYPSLHTHIPALRQRGVNVEFNPRIPRTLLKKSGDNQSGVSGETLANPFVVEVRDRWNRAFAGIEVTFTVTVGGGTLSVTSTTTDPNGRAESTLTLGSDAGMNTVSVSAEGIQGTVTFNAVTEIIEFDLSVPADTSLIHVPLKVTEVDGMAQTIESIADLYDALGSVDTVNYLVTHDPHTQKWHSYLAPSDKGTPADSTLTDDMGIIAGMKQPVTIRLGGNPLGANGSSSITVHQGTNLVGVPLKNSEIVHVSDLLTLDGIKDNVSAITVSDSGAFKVVTAAGVPGDIAITGGQSFIMGARRAATVTISGQGWSNVSGTSAAPPLALGVSKWGDTTPVLVLRGSIVDEQAGLNKLGFRVTVKNLSTGRAVTTVKAPDETGYQFTVVDIETGRAATIGDVLEVSTRSANPQNGVEPLRYTVTAEDVKRSYIQLPELVVYEIPAETELLANYPNPFNPETWIPYRLAEDAFVRLTIYDGVGQVVRSLEVGHRIAAAYESRSKAIYWDGRNGLGEQVASGIYFYHLSAGDYSATRKMLIVK